MNGPEHYLRAEAALANTTWESDAERAELLASARVHALLAIAAALGLNDTVDGMPFRDRDAWQATAGVRPVTGQRPKAGEQS